MKKLHAEYAAIICSALTFAGGVIAAIEFSDDVFDSIHSLNSSLVEGGSNRELVPTTILSLIETVAAFAVPTVVMSFATLAAAYRGLTKKEL